MGAHNAHKHTLKYMQPHTHDTHGQQTTHPHTVHTTHDPFIHTAHLTAQQKKYNTTYTHLNTIDTHIHTPHI